MNEAHSLAERLREAAEHPAHANFALCNTKLLKDAALKLEQLDEGCRWAAEKYNEIIREFADYKKERMNHEVNAK